MTDLITLLNDSGNIGLGYTGRCVEDHNVLCILVPRPCSHMICPDLPTSKMASLEVLARKPGNHISNLDVLDKSHILV